MKYILLFIILISLNFAELFSQKIFTPYTEIGGKVGMSPYTNTFFVDSINPVLFNSTLIGIRFLHVEQKHGGVIFEINYNKAFATIDNNTYTYDYIQTPLMTHVYIPIKEASVAINIGSYLQFITDKRGSRLLIERDLMFGLAGGLSLSVPIKRISFTLEGRYNHNLFPNSRNDYSKMSNWLELSVAVSYRTKWHNRETDN